MLVLYVHQQAIMFVLLIGQLRHNNSGTDMFFKKGSFRLLLNG